jgi:hypothetical protein
VRLAAPAKAGRVPGRHRLARLSRNAVAGKMTVVTIVTNAYEEVTNMLAATVTPLNALPTAHPASDVARAQAAARKPAR